MHWIAPSEKDTDNAAVEKRLWDAAEQVRGESGLKSQEYSAPVLGLIFLRFAEIRFAAQRAQLESPSPLGGERAGVRGESHPRPLDVVVACVSSDAFVAEASATANGAKTPRANWDVLEKFPAVIPKGEVAERFSALFTDIIAQQQALNHRARHTGPSRL